MSAPSGKYVDSLRNTMQAVASSVLTHRADPKDPRLGDLVDLWDGVGDPRELAARADVVIVGAPDDTGIVQNRGRRGAARGPEAIRRKLYALTPGALSRVDRVRIADLGDVIPAGADVARTHDRVIAAIAAIRDKGAVPVLLGGGHDLTYAGVRGFLDGLGYVEESGADSVSIGLVYADAHLDVRDLSFGITSGTPFRRLLDLPGEPVARGRALAIGLQEHHNAVAHLDYARSNGMVTLFLDDVSEIGVSEAARQAMARAGDGGLPVAVSIDIDVARQADAPGASASYPAGLGARDLEVFARIAGSDQNVGYFDIMEVSPPLDVDGRTAALAASLVFHFLAGFVSRRARDFSLTSHAR